MEGGGVFFLLRPDPVDSTGVLTEHGFEEGLQLSLEALCPGNRVFVLVPPCKVRFYVSLIRSLAHGKITGSLSAHEWMASCLDFVVATPEEANKYYYVFPDSVAAVLIDASGDEHFRSQAGYFVRIRCFETVVGPEVPHLAEFISQPVSALQTDRQVRWFAPQPPARTSGMFLALIRSLLPEAENGWGDQEFAHATHHFVLPGWSYVCYDWSGVVGMIPVLAREAYEFKTRAMLVAPEEKLVPLDLLVQQCVQELGITFPTDSGVMVLGPDSVPPPADCVSITVVAEADTLLERWPKWKEFILRSGQRVGLHVNRKTELIQELVQNDQFQMTSTKASISMEHVCQFYALEVNEDNRFKMLCELLQQFQRSSPHEYSIYCHTPERAHELAAALKAQGIHAFAVHWVSDPVLEEVYRNPYAVVVTSVYSRGDYSVINYEMPHSDEEYVRRVGRDRNMRERVVINLATKQELEKLSAFSEMVPLPSDCRNLHKRLVLWFGHR